MLDKKSLDIKIQITIVTPTLVLRPSVKAEKIEKYSIWRILFMYGNIQVTIWRTQSKRQKNNAPKWGRTLRSRIRKIPYRRH